MNAMPIAVPASATMIPPITVIAAPIAIQYIRSSRSANATANSAQARNPNAPTATMRPASGGGYLSEVSSEVKPAPNANTVT
ncbi:MAG: hypothetical protein JO243_16095 [Solirubrobacterales bacterium]|nr:hypothetical protein [Solirubrobacterales bacterium]